MDPGSDNMLSDSQLNGELDSTSDCSNSDSGKDSSTDLLELMNDDHTCQICEAQLSQPRILSCLHVFCTGCLEKQVEDCNEGSDAASAEGAAAIAEGAAGTKMGIIQCIVCKQNSLLPPDGVQGLPLDSVLAMVVDKSDSDDGQILCTSCKAQEKAVAQCSDCATFLCPGCVTAHQFMRCFENHKVVSFEDLQSTEGGKIIKPIFCEKHVTEVINQFCTICRKTLCSECLAESHADHTCDKIEAVKDGVVGNLKKLMDESKKKLEFCREASTALESGLDELQTQQEQAKGSITEMFQSCKAVLERLKDEKMEELDRLHKDQELHIMDMYNTVDKTIEKIEHGCKLGERYIESGNDTHILTMEKYICKQLTMLVNNTPKLDVTVNIQFDSDINNFTAASTKSFGSFTKPLVAAVNPIDHQIDDEELIILQDRQVSSSVPPSAFNHQGDAFGMPINTDAVLSGSPDLIPGLESLTPLSIPNLASGLPITNTMSVISPHTINNIASSMANLPPERSSSRNSYSPADNRPSLDTASGGLTTNNNMVNFAMLSKMGSISFGSQGQVSVNGQLIPGLNMKNISGLPPPPSTPSPRVQTPHSEASLASLLGGISLSGANSGFTTTPESQQNITELLNMLSATPTPSTTPLPGVMTNDPIANMFSNQTSPTQAGYALQRSGFNTTPPAAASNFFGAQQQSLATRHPTSKMSTMQIRSKFGQLGPGKTQFNSPHGFCLGLDEDIIVADTNNHRIQVFDKGGEPKWQFGIPGREEGQLWYPRKVAVMRESGKYVVCDRGSERSRMQLFNKNGHFVKKIAIRYIDIVAGLAITPQGHIVAVDSVSPTVFCIAESGDLLKWFDCSDFMREPSDIAINNKDYFVCDFKGHCVVVFNEEGEYMRRIGCENITNFPNGIDISDAGDVLVGDSHGNRFHVAVFQRDGSLIGEFECPYVKVSRCCGLKITTEGYVVTLAKNNHHVLVLNTLYIT